MKNYFLASLLLIASCAPITFSSKAPVYRDGVAYETRVAHHAEGFYTLGYEEGYDVKQVKVNGTWYDCGDLTCEERVDAILARREPDGSEGDDSSGGGGGYGGGY